LEEKNKNMAFPVGAVIGAGASLIGGAFGNRSRKREAEKQRQFSESMWNKQNAYNTPKMQMERLKAAGLNPALMYGQGNVGNAEKAMPYQQPQIENIGAGVAQAAAAGSQIDLLQEQKSVLRAEAIQKLANAENLKSTSNRTNQLVQAELSNITSGTRKIDNEAQLIEQTIKHQKDTGMLKGDILGNIAKTLGININTPEGKETAVKKINGLILLRGIQTIAPSLINLISNYLPTKLGNKVPWDKLSDADKTKALQKFFNSTINKHE